MNIKHIHNTVVFLLSFYLLIDTFNGFLILRIGLDLKLSVVYKSLILFLIVLSLINQNLRYIIGGLSLFTILLFGEIVSIMLGDTTGDKLLFTAQHIFKLLTPLILFIYLRNLIIASPLFIHKVLRILKINCAVYLLNIFIGILGFGFSTYGGDVSDTSIGVKGFFYAGNEVSMLMVVFSAFILGKYYRVSKKLYLFWALVWIIVGFAVSTKTAMAANLILVVFIPIVIERTSLIDMSSKKFYLFASFLSCFFISIFMLVNSFIQSNIYGRLSYVFEKQGVVGLILSGRDQFLIDLMNLFFYKDSIFNLIFGNGVSFYADKLKYSTELDLPDVFLWHGILGIVIVLYIFTTFTKSAFFRFTSSSYPFAPVILITNILLFIIANISGHVFTSGMLGFLWPCFCVLSYFKSDVKLRKNFIAKVPNT